jgi:hypothetical protein
MIDDDELAVEGKKDVRRAEKAEDADDRSAGEDRRK